MKDIFTPARTVSPKGYVDYTQYHIVGLHDDAVCTRVLGHERTCILVVRTGNLLRAKVLEEAKLEPNGSKVLSPANFWSLRDMSALQEWLAQNEKLKGKDWKREWQLLSKHLRGPNQCAEVDL